MIVNTGYSPLLYQRKSVKSNEMQKADDFFSLPEKSKSEIKGDQGADIWGELSKSYNIRNASFKEIVEISAKLYDTGQISLLDHAILTFDPNYSPQSTIKSNIQMTQFNPDGRKDWIVEYVERAQKDLRTNNLMGYANNQRIVEILKRLL